MLLDFQCQENYSIALSDANKKIKELEGSWKPIQFQTFSEETQAFGKMYYVTVLFEKVEKL